MKNPSCPFTGFNAHESERRLINRINNPEEFHERLREAGVDPTIREQLANQSTDVQNSIVSALNRGAESGEGRNEERERQQPGPEMREPDYHPEPTPQPAPPPEPYAGHERSFWRDHWLGSSIKGAATLGLTATGVGLFASNAAAMARVHPVLGKAATWTAEAIAPIASGTAGLASLAGLGTLYGALWGIGKWRLEHGKGLLADPKNSLTQEQRAEIVDYIRRHEGGLLGLKTAATGLRTVAGFPLRILRAPFVAGGKTTATAANWYDRFKKKIGGIGNVLAWPVKNWDGVLAGGAAGGLSGALAYGVMSAAYGTSVVTAAPALLGAIGAIAGYKLYKNWRKKS